MRSCWHEDPDKRLTFRQLHRALNKLDKERQVQFSTLINVQKLQKLKQKTSNSGIYTVTTSIKATPQNLMLTIDFPQIIGLSRLHTKETTSLEVFVLF